LTKKHRVSEKIYFRERKKNILLQKKEVPIMVTPKNGSAAADESRKNISVTDKELPV